VLLVLQANEVLPGVMRKMQLRSLALKMLVFVFSLSVIMEMCCSWRPYSSKLRKAITATKPRYARFLSEQTEEAKRARAAARPEPRDSKDAKSDGKAAPPAAYAFIAESVSHERVSG
jgi:hypothetical protein